MLVSSLTIRRTHLQYVLHKENVLVKYKSSRMAGSQAAKSPFQDAGSPVFLLHAEVLSKPRKGAKSTCLWASRLVLGGGNKTIEHKVPLCAL